MCQFILTIAFPTYNRAEILDQTLSSLLADPAYDPEKIEVIVSDNASTDHTADVVMKYPDVKYFCNEMNIGFANFTTAMGYATGKYIRLMNDTARFNSGMLGKIMTEIENADYNVENIIFANKLLKIDQGVVFVKNGNSLIGLMSYLITWVVNFGIWKQDFEKMENKNRCVSSLMQHVDWFLRMADNGKPTKVIVDHFLVVDKVKKKGTYDIFDVFINKYISILKLNHIGFWRLKIEKYRLFRYFILCWYFLLKEDKQYTFDMKGVKIIYRKYWYEPYFIPLMVLKYIKTNSIKMLKQ